MEFKDILKKELNKRNMTQKELSDVTDICVATIWNYTNGKHGPRLNELITIADTLNISLDYLTGRKRNEGN